MNFQACEAPKLAEKEILPTSNNEDKKRNF